MKWRYVVFMKRNCDVCNFNFLEIIFYLFCCAKMLSRKSLIMKDQAINVIYVTSRGHSGSMLFAHLLGAHPSIVGVGEIKMLSQDKDERKLCSCHQLPPAQCPFWGSVQEQVVQRIGKHLHELDLEGEDPCTFLQDNAALFESIAHVRGLRAIVDSSKSLPRAIALCHAFGGSDS